MALLLPPLGVRPTTPAPRLTSTIISVTSRLLTTEVSTDMAMTTETILTTTGTMSSTVLPSWAGSSTGPEDTMQWNHTDHWNSTRGNVTDEYYDDVNTTGTYPGSAEWTLDVLTSTSTVDYTSNVTSYPDEVDPDYMSMVTERWAYFMLLFIPLMSVITNTWVLVIIRRTVRLHRMMYCLLASLSCSDLLYALLVMPLALTRTLLQTFPVPMAVCRVWLCLDVLFRVSSLVHVSLAIYDCQATLLSPLKSKLHNALSFVVIQVSLAWVGAILLTVPFLTVLQTMELASEDHYWGCGPITLPHTLAWTVPAFFAPVALLILLMFNTIRVSHMQAVLAHQLESASNSTSTGDVTGIDRLEGMDVVIVPADKDKNANTNLINNSNYMKHNKGEMERCASIESQDSVDLSTLSPDCLVPPAIPGLDPNQDVVLHRTAANSPLLGTIPVEDMSSPEQTDREDSEPEKATPKRKKQGTPEKQENEKPPCTQNAPSNNVTNMVVSNHPEESSNDYPPPPPDTNNRDQEEEESSQIDTSDTFPDPPDNLDYPSDNNYESGYQPDNESDRNSISTDSMNNDPFPPHLGVVVQPSLPQGNALPKHHPQAGALFNKIEEVIATTAQLTRQGAVDIDPDDGPAKHPVMHDASALMDHEALHVKGIKDTHSSALKHAEDHVPEPNKLAPTTPEHSNKLAPNSPEHRNKLAPTSPEHSNRLALLSPEHSNKPCPERMEGDDATISASPEIKPERNIKTERSPDEKTQRSKKFKKTRSLTKHSEPYGDIYQNDEDSSSLDSYPGTGPGGKEKLKGKLSKEYLNVPAEDAAGTDILTELERDTRRLVDDLDNLHDHMMTHGIVNRAFHSLDLKDLNDMEIDIPVVGVKAEEGDTPLADSIQVRSDNNKPQNGVHPTQDGQQNGAKPEGDKPPGPLLADPQSTRSSFSTGSGIDGPRRSILRRDGSKRGTNRKSVKFASNVNTDSAKKKPSGKRMPRRATGPRRPVSRQGSKGSRSSSSSSSSKSSNGSVRSHHKLQRQVSKAPGDEEVSVTASQLQEATEYMSSTQLKHSKRISRRVHEQKHTLRLLTIIFLVYLVLAFPYYIVYTMVGVCPSCHTETLMFALLITEWLSRCTAFVNPFIYLLANVEFRRSVLHCCISCCCHCRRKS